MRELGVVCRCTFYTSEMNTHSYMPFLFSINFLCHLSQLDFTVKIPPPQGYGKNSGTAYFVFRGGWTCIIICHQVM